MIAAGNNAERKIYLFGQQHMGRRNEGFCICSMIKGEINALEAVEMLMGRKTKNEMQI